MEERLCLRIVRQEVITKENSHACYDRLKSLVLLIAIAYTCAIIKGCTIKQMGIQEYVGRVQELGRSVRRHSNFWIGLYGECWVTGSEVCGSSGFAV